MEPERECADDPELQCECRDTVEVGRRQRDSHALSRGTSGRETGSTGRTTAIAAPALVGMDGGDGGGARAMLVSLVGSAPARRHVGAATCRRVQRRHLRRPTPGPLAVSMRAGAYSGVTTAVGVGIRLHAEHNVAPLAVCTEVAPVNKKSEVEDDACEAQA
eukprot:scaffold874_cov380-Prasinococcus_capsulatus_cf.AAC.13